MRDNDDLSYSTSAIESLYTAMLADAVRTVQSGRHPTHAEEAGHWLIDAGVPLVKALGLGVDTDSIAPWVQRQLAYRQAARFIRKQLREELRNGAQR